MDPNQTKVIKVFEYNPSCTPEYYQRNQCGEYVPAKELSLMSVKGIFDPARPLARFEWSDRPYDPNEEDKEDDEGWAKLSKASWSETIFNAVKIHLNYDGEDKDMKNSDEMILLLRSNTTLTVSKPAKKKEGVAETINITFNNGRISWPGPNYNERKICSQETCWFRSTRDKNTHCDNHAVDLQKTHFLIRDQNNPAPTFALISSTKHAAGSVMELRKVIKLPKRGIKNYAEDRRKLGQDVKWIEVQKWISEDSIRCMEFEHTTRSFFVILTCIFNSAQVDSSKWIYFIRERVWCKQTNWEIVKIMLGNCGMKFHFGVVSEFANTKASPFLDVVDLRRKIGDKWIYMIFGKVANLYIGKVEQRKLLPVVDSVIADYHPHYLKALPLYQCTDDDSGYVKSETEMMERVGQVALAILEMEKVEIDGKTVKMLNKILENDSEWSERHGTALETMLGWLSGKEPHLIVPDKVNVSAINWQPLVELL